VHDTAGIVVSDKAVAFRGCIELVIFGEDSCGPMAFLATAFTDSRISLILLYNARRAPHGVSSQYLENPAV